MPRPLALALVLLAVGCTSPNPDYVPPVLRPLFDFDAGALVPPPDLAVEVQRGAPDAAEVPDLAAPDLAEAVDAAGERDDGAEVDAAGEVDGGVLFDLAAPPDLATVADLFDRACLVAHCEGAPDMGTCGPAHGFDCCPTPWPFNLACRAPGETCASDADCDPGNVGKAIGACVGGRCCGGWGRACAVGADCCSGRCLPMPGGPGVCR